MRFHRPGRAGLKPRRYLFCMDLTSHTATEIRDRLTRKEVSAEELVRAHLERIAQKDKEVRAFLTLCPDRALAQAK